MTKIEFSTGPAVGVGLVSVSQTADGKAAIIKHNDADRKDL